MKLVKALPLFSMLLIAVCSSGQNNAAAQPGPPVKLWAAIGVAKPVFQSGEMGEMALSFFVVNDGPTAADLHIESSHLLVNGVEPQRWDMVIGNGLRNAYWKSLPPRKLLSFNYQLGPTYFSAPGVYTVRWEGQDFRSAEVTFRVLPPGEWY